MSDIIEETYGGSSSSFWISVKLSPNPKEKGAATTRREN
jgi:hypothetical protein